MTLAQQNKCCGAFLLSHFGGYLNLDTFKALKQSQGYPSEGSSPSKFAGTLAYTSVETEAYDIQQLKRLGFFEKPPTNLYCNHNYILYQYVCGYRFYYKNKDAFRVSNTTKHNHYSSL